MIINKKAENLVLTYCNLCGSFVGNGGRLDLSITFDKNVIYNDDYLNSFISTNICPRCAKKLVETVNDAVNKTDAAVTEAKVTIGMQFESVMNSIISDNSLSIEAPEEENANDEEDSKSEVVEDKSNPLKTEFVKELSEEDGETLETLCDMYKDTIKDSREFIDDFIKEFPMYSSVLYTKNVEDSMEFIRLIVRDNSKNYRLKKPFSGGHWYMHKYLSMERAQKEKAKVEAETIHEETNPKNQNTKSNSKKRLWTEEEDEFLRENYYKLGVKECAEKLDRSISSCRSRVTDIGMTKHPRTIRRWSKSELEFLKVNYEKLGIQKCAEKLGRSVSSCNNKLREFKNGLTM